MLVPERGEPTTNTGAGATRSEWMAE